MKRSVVRFNRTGSHLRVGCAWCSCAQIVSCPRGGVSPWSVAWQWARPTAKGRTCRTAIGRSPQVPFRSPRAAYPVSSNPLQTSISPEEARQISERDRVSPAGSEVAPVGASASRACQAQPDWSLTRPGALSRVFCLRAESNRTQDHGQDEDDGRQSSHSGADLFQVGDRHRTSPASNRAPLRELQRGTAANLRRHRDRIGSTGAGVSTARSLPPGLILAACIRR